MYLKLVSGQVANCKKGIFRYIIIIPFLLLLLWFVVFQDLGFEIPAFVVVVLARLNSFETLRLKTFGKKAKYRCVPKIGSAGGAKIFN